jgi:hypothetical protein
MAQSWWQWLRGWWNTGWAHHKSSWSVCTRARQRARIAQSVCLYRIETVSIPVMTYCFSWSDTSNTIQQHAHIDIADNDTDSRYTDPYIHVTRFKRVPKELSPKVLQARASRPPASARHPSQRTRDSRQCIGTPCECGATAARARRAARARAHPLTDLLGHPRARAARPQPTPTSLGPRADARAGAATRHPPCPYLTFSYNGGELK